MRLHPASQVAIVYQEDDADVGGALIGFADEASAQDFIEQLSRNCSLDPDHFSIRGDVPWAIRPALI